MPKAQARKQWVYSPKKPTISPTLKQEVEQKAQPLVQMLKEKYIQPPPMGYPFNYLTEIWTKWHRSAFYFCGTYACSSPNAISSTCEVRYARMTYAGQSLKEASDAVLKEIRELGGVGGLVGIDAEGNIVMPYTSEDMFCGYKREGEEFIQLFPNPEE